MAAPAGSWILTIAMIFFFAIWKLVLLSDGRLQLRFDHLELRDLANVELHRGLATEDVDQHLDLELGLR